MFIRHATIERHAFLLLILILITVAIGGLVEIVPLFTIETTIERVKGVRPYSPLELAGRDVYISEGCYLCHSQQIRPFRDEVERYGHYSLAAESMYDHPFQWGSERTGPDLARVGGKYSNEWHIAHLTNPRDVVPESIMPGYSFLAEAALDPRMIEAHLRANKAVGVPYSDEMIADAATDFRTQADPTAENGDLLKRYPGAATSGTSGDRISKMDALIAYLQVLGTEVKFRDVTPDDVRQ
jgi:cytochrome c oxidase cbb3-type subunit II